MTTDELLRRIAPDQRLLLRAVLCTDEVAREALVEWRQRVVLEDLPDAAHRLLPLLARRMGDIAPDDPVRDLIRGTYRLAWVKNHLITRDAGTVAGALQREGIPVLVLKGAALVGYYGGDWGSRPMYDVDVLVPTDQAERAFHVLRVEGWEPARGITAGWWTSRIVPRRHSWAFSRGLEEQLDLHWHVLRQSLGAHADDRFWANRSEIELAGVKVGALSPPDLVLHLLAHGVGTTRQGQVQWIADAVHVLRATDASLLAEPLASGARQHGLLSTVQAALETIDLLLDEPAVGPLLVTLSGTRRPLLERIAMTDGRGVTNPARIAATLLLRHGGGGEGLLSRLSGLARQRLDLDHVTRRAFYVAHVASGRRPGVAALARRAWTTFVQTSRPPAVDLGTGLDLDFTSPETSDHHAGPGWRTLDERGLTSQGSEGRVVVDLQDPGEGDLELSIVACSDNQQPARVEVRVNERIVARAMVGPLDSPTELRVHLPAAVAWRFRPLEIGLFAATNGVRVVRRRVGIRLVSLRLSRAGSSPAPERPERPSGSRRGAG